ncbi:ATP-dependent Clp protease adaptor ClpS [Vicingaceae bacterium]|jgi:ATP-dependent Clp protease adaptor protein ClpS|nr:ATP-dependent Clp protease adaptor ClpS [Vicingaceae bacterium]
MTETLVEEVVSVKKQVVKDHILVLFDDNVNTFDHVIDLLVKVCKHDSIQAEQCATLVHHTGKCAIKKGSFKDLQLMAELLGDSGLTVEIN